MPANTVTAAAYTDSAEGADAGRRLGTQLREALGGERPDAVIVFASSRFVHAELLQALSEAAEPRLLVGASSAGEFVRGHRGEGTACALAIRSTELELAVGIGHGISEDRARAAREVVSTFRGSEDGGHRYRTALVLTDALAGHADQLIEQLTVATSGKYQFAGGGAGDDAPFSRTHVFCGTEICSNAVVALEILSDRPVGIGVGHGWSRGSGGYRVTDVDGDRLISLNGMPAVEIFEEHARATNQTFERSAPLPYFLHNIIGIEGSGTEDRLRVPLSVHEDGSITCAAGVPLGATIYVMKATTESAVAAARQATRSALQGLHGERPGAALFFDCVATRLRLGDAFDFELGSVSEALGGAHLVGCNTYGQIARAEGQFGGFHNCTAVVLALPA